MLKLIFRSIIFIAVVVLLFVGWKTISARMPREHTVEIPARQSRLELAETIGKALEWEPAEVTAFASTHAQMQWAEWNTPFKNILTEKFDWDEDRQETFLISSTKYFSNPTFDFFAQVYVPGTYTIPSESSAAQIAGLLITRVKEDKAANLQEFIAANLTASAVDAIGKFIQSEYELLPDLVPLPAQDVKIDKIDGVVRMYFTTVYYNQGKGPLELRADTKTAGQRRDLERDVFQRIYFPDGGYRDRVAGNFMWHQSHLHYHFADFILYDLEPVEVEGPTPDLSGVLAKSTFCIRDISIIEMELENRPKDAIYEICGKEKQGISVGWGDAYFYNYPDQNLNITDLPSGTYRLTFKANPENRFDESDTTNNTSSVLMKIDTTAATLEILESTPKEIPVFKHVYPTQDQTVCPACRL